MKIRILFVYPNFYDAYGPNLSITHVATYVNKMTHHKARILDLTLQKRNWKEVIKKSINNFDIIGFTTTIPTIVPSLEVAREIKRINPHIPIIFGGIYATCVNKEILQFDEVDYICVGEGEISFSQLLDSLESGEAARKLEKIKGIWYKENNQIVENGLSPLIENLDSLPFLDYSLWNPKLLWKFIDHIPMMGARGCLFQCAFCTQWAMHQYYRKDLGYNYYRIRSPQHICDEIEYQVKKYQKIKEFKGVLFNDDTFTANRRFVEAFCEEYTKRGLNKKLHWAINARIDTIDKDLLLKMKKAGCYYLYFGVESHSDNTRIIYEKRFNQKQVEDTIKLAKKMGFKIKTYYMINGPDENVHDSLETLKYAWKLEPDTCHFMPFVPIPNTKAAEIYKERSPRKFKEISDIINPLQFSTRNLKKDTNSQFFYLLLSIVIGHMPISYVQMIKNILLGFFSSDKEKELYSYIIITTIWKYLIISIKLGKLEFIRDMFRFLRLIARYGFVISDLFYLTLKKYQLNDSFN